jgi:hypothetical protein
MPATENTWRDLKTLHVVFGFTGLLLLIATVALFAADHRREWKQYQRKMRDIDVRLTNWQMEAENTRAAVAQGEQLQESLKKAEASPPQQSAFDQFMGLLGDHPQASALRDLYEASKQPEQGASSRSKLQEAMGVIVRRERFLEDKLLSDRKFKSADYDEKRANLDLGIRDNLTDALPGLQAEVDKVRSERDQLTVEYEKLSARRKGLEGAFKSVTADVDSLKKEIENAAASQERLETSLKEREATYFSSQFPFLGKKWLELPVLDAFNSPLKIDTRWTKNLTMPNGGFGEVRRFDRCTTCHQAIDRTAPGSATEPLYEEAHQVDLTMATPESAPAPQEGENAAGVPTLLSVYGIEIAPSGLADASAVTVRNVLPNSLAANAKIVHGDITDGLKVGDILRMVDNDRVLTKANADQFLLRDAQWGQPLRIQVERGLPQPFNSHPRMDLFVGSMSPHTIQRFGCTVCHEGQGSATEFKWVSHTPNDPGQEAQWVKEHGWFNNHHWIYPMQPARFAESTCLKCHHNVVELEASSKFDEPPAPQLMAGYHLIRQYGCYGCHEINGYNGPDKRIGPDMRLEPNYFAAAAQLKTDPNFTQLSADQKKWVETLIQHPEQEAQRHQLLEFLKNDAKAEESVLGENSHSMISVLEDQETPGTFRKSGPSLRHVSTKVGAEWLYDWIRDPTHFRPSTRMPRFFGLWDHLDDVPGERQDSQRYEPIEILGLVTYLMKSSQPVEMISPGDALPEQPEEDQIARGKLLFETRGCLACHQHQDFPVGKATHGPELSNLGDKFRSQDTPDARKWLYTWLKNPNLYHPRTKMPDLLLDPIKHADGTTTDPAADIAAYLLSSSTGWEISAQTKAGLTAKDDDLNSLVKEHLRTKLYRQDADDAVDAGKIPAELAKNLTGAELFLAGEMSQENKLIYIGHKTIAKYGCYACHDIPGFEGDKPIGTGLADWGRKDPSRLAFEHIAEYIEHGHGHAHGGDSHSQTRQGMEESHSEDAHAPAAEGADPGDALAANNEPFDESFFTERLMHHDRTGFLWQKLKEPRSYDYKKTRNKDSFNDRLRMPLFPFNPKQREAVATFVLGLLAEPPADEFVYQADDRQKAILAGHKALTKFNCVGCHIVDPETWTLEAPKGSFAAQPSDPDATFPFMPHHFTSMEAAASEKVDANRDTVTARLRGMPEISSAEGKQRVLDEEGDEITEDGEYDASKLIYPFELWEPAILEGNAYQVGLPALEVQSAWIKRRLPTFGGDLTKWLLPRAVELEKEANPQADGKQVYGWLPPPLLGEGNKVQTEWLYEFLLEPHKIRPAVLMRMPKFNMSSQEATDLANYFAAKDNASYPYEADPATDLGRLREEDAKYREQVQATPEAERPRGDGRFDHVMNIVTSSNYCVQCHIVGDFEPKTSDRAKAPDLSVVNARLRPDYLKRWIANPKQILPYTPMPVNVKYNAQDPKFLGGVEQKLYRGTSLEQLDALVDLLMNYQVYTKERAPVAELVPTAPAAAPGASTTTAESSTSSEAEGSEEVQ